jgi:hypothetical protein
VVFPYGGGGGRNKILFQLGAGHDRSVEPERQNGRECKLHCILKIFIDVPAPSSSPTALQPNLGLGFFNPPPSNISAFCRSSPVLAFYSTLSILINYFIHLRLGLPFLAFLRNLSFLNNCVYPFQLTFFLLGTLLGTLSVLS